MNIIEALKEVRNGKLVSRKSWFDNVVLKVASLKVSSVSKKIVVFYTCDNTEYEEYEFTANDIEADDWIIRHFKAPLTFVEAFKEVKNNGKKLKRNFWKDDCYIDGYTKLIQLVEADLIANDWEVME